MKRFGQHVGLFMALVMTFGLLAPFATPVWARDATVPSGNVLALHRNMVLEPLHGNHSTQLRRNVPGRERPYGAVMTSWPVSAGGDPFMYVLRFFDHLGRRHELSVLQIAAFDEAGNHENALMVNFDVFDRFPTTGAIERYTHVSDPVRPSPGGGFAIYAPGGVGFQSANAYFVYNSGWGSTPDTNLGPSFPRANDRPRFALVCEDDACTVADCANPMHIDRTLTHTPVRSDFLSFSPNTNQNSDDVPFNTEDDPTYYLRLSPSFNIGDGQGFSFRFVDNNAFHFLWEDGQFYFFIEGNQARPGHPGFFRQGKIYDITLERFVGTAIADYVIGTDALPPAGNRRVGANDRNYVGTPETVFVFNGFDENTINPIPFAASATAGVPNTRSARLGGHDGNLLNSPNFDTSPIRVQTTSPAAQDLGLDIRFNMPAFFDEAQGGFYTCITTNPLGLAQQPQVYLYMRIEHGGMETVTSECFSVTVPIEGLYTQVYSPAAGNGNNGDNGSWMDENVAFHQPGADRPAGEHEIGLRNVSLLHRQGMEDADRLRIKVGGLRPSTLYERVVLRLNDLPDNFLSLPESDEIHGIPFYTFLTFTFERLMGQNVLVVEPFNFNLDPVNRRLVRTGWYQLDVQGPQTGFEPVNVAAFSPNVQFTLPDTLGEELRFEITWSSTNPRDEGAVLTRFSQNVIWRPDMIPDIDMPHHFRVSAIPDRLLHRPMREAPRPGEALPSHFQAGYLEYRLEWDIAPVPVLTQILETANCRVRLDYTVGLSTAPEAGPLGPALLTGLRDYLRVSMEIRRMRDANGVLLSGFQVRYLGTQRSNDVTLGSDFIAVPGGTPAIESRFLGNQQYAATPHPIQNRAEVIAERDGAANPEGWQTLRTISRPELQASAAVVSLDILTNTVRRDRFPPPPDNLRNDIDFPGVHFMTVRLHEWRHLTSDNPAFRGGESEWSLFDYIVIDDFGTLDVPPPANIQVEAGQVSPDAIPFLDVDFSVPARAITAYMNTLYPMYTQITTNLYIGQFYDEMSNTFFPGGNPISHAGRVNPANALSIPFASLASQWNGGPVFRTELDLSEDRIQHVLRAAQTGNPSSGVVRITDIPLIRSVPGITTTPVALNLGEALNVSHNSARDEADLFAVTASVLENEGYFPVRLRLTGMEENTAFFVFADLEIEKFTNESGRFTRPAPSPLYTNPAISAFTGIVSDTTTGTPPEPGPGEIFPPAPQNLGVRYITQTEATIHWDPIGLSREEVDGGVSIEWEMLRIQAGARLSDAQMNNRNANFLEFLNSEEIRTNSPRRKAWATTGNDLRVTTVTPPAITMPAMSAASPNNYIYRHSGTEISLRDMSLHPNNLYFYYVRTVRIVEMFDAQLQDYVLIRTVSAWVEVPVTTLPIAPPAALRQENSGTRAGFDGQTMALVSWSHPEMPMVVAGIGTLFAFEFQIREGENAWRPYFTVPHNLMTTANIHSDDPNRMQFLVTGLEHSSVYQMRVRLVDLAVNDRSIWSNVITVLTDIDPGQDRLERETDDWLGYLRRRLEELLRRPFWPVQDSSTSSILVFRPGDVFAGQLLAHPDTPVRLHNTGVNHVVYYLPLSNILTANEYNRGFITSFPDMEFLLAPSLVNAAHNQAMLDVLRAIDERGSDLSDAFLRMEIGRSHLDSVFGVPALTPRTNVNMTLVATNDSIRGLEAWDRTMSTRAERIVERWLNDPVIREGVTEHLLAYSSNETISDHIYNVLERVDAEIRREAAGFITTARDGILTARRFPITEFDSAMHVVATQTAENMFIAGYRNVGGNWQAETLFEVHNGRAFLARTPGEFAFAGRIVEIAGIETVPRGPVVISIVARYGLEDLFGVNVDLAANANREMVVGSIARAAGVPQGADAFAWANANLNVTLSSRNAAGLISNQEAIAVIMSLYEHRTNTRISTMRINNPARTAAMNLDARYAQAVRAAFEMGIVTDTALNPAGSVTIGQFLDMLTLLNSRVRV